MPFQFSVGPRVPRILHSVVLHHCGSGLVPVLAATVRLDNWRCILAATAVSPSYSRCGGRRNPRMPGSWLTVRYLVEPRIVGVVHVLLVGREVAGNDDARRAILI